MSGSFPVSLGIRTESIESRFVNMVNRAQSGVRSVANITSHLWAIRITTIPMARADWQQMEAFLTKQKGRFDTFTYVSQSKTLALGAVSGSPQVVGAHSAGDETIAIDGFANSTLVLKAGDLIKFENHNKVYMVTADATSDGGGAATVSIVPGLVNTLADNEALSYDSVPFTMALVRDAIVIDAAVDGFVVFDIEMEEQFNS